jgi:peptidoglycan/xylan/chitin deacetylase (PgdA/CDA1 family)
LNTRARLWATAAAVVAVVVLAVIVAVVATRDTTSTTATDSGDAAGSVAGNTSTDGSVAGAPGECPSTPPTTLPGPTITLPTPPRTDAITTTSTAPTGPAVRVTRGDPSLPRVALSFDAGSDAGSTTRILDLLAARNIKASFGLTGAWACAHPELVRRMATEGHHLINHTDDHRSFTGASTNTAALTAAERTGELTRADDTIRAITGRSTQPWFRPPYGDLDASVDTDVAAAGYSRIALWSLDSLGWKGLPAAEITTRCLDAAANGTIYLFHVGVASADADALPAILDGLAAKSLSPGTIPFALGQG